MSLITKAYNSSSPLKAVNQSIARLAIAAPVLAKSFNNEILKIKGETVRRVMERTAQFGINNYLARGSHTEKLSLIHI